MCCYFCRKSKKANPFASADKCTNFGTSTLQRHKDCKEHEDAVSKETMRDTFSNTECRVLRKQSQVIHTAMRAIYWLDKVDIAIVKHDSLLNFLDEIGLESAKNLRVGGSEEWSLQGNTEMRFCCETFWSIKHSTIIDPLFKREISLDSKTLTFLVCITFLLLQESGKKNHCVGLPVYM